MNEHNYDAFTELNDIIGNLLYETLDVFKNFKSLFLENYCKLLEQLKFVIIFIILLL